MSYELAWPAVGGESLYRAGRIRQFLHSAVGLSSCILMQP